MRAALFIVLMVLALPSAQAARHAAHPARQAVTADDINTAEPAKGSSRSSESLNIRAQVLLDRARFSPGVIDGRHGENFATALGAFQRENGLETSPEVDAATFEKLTQDSEPAMITYTITDKDVAGPFTAKIPHKLDRMAELRHLDYTSPAELLAERFHMDEGLLRALNPGKALDQAGTEIDVANVNVKPVALQEKIGKLEVDKKQKALRVLSPDGKLIALYPATIGSKEKPAPSGTLKVVRVAHNPTYTYNPAFQFKGVKAKRELRIAPGPNNPVGVVWIALNEKSYGIHGTPDPEKVGKTASHGCVRLTNWDALALAAMVHKGTEVDFVD